MGQHTSGPRSSVTDSDKSPDDKTPSLRVRLRARKRVITIILLLLVIAAIAAAVSLGPLSSPATTRVGRMVVAIDGIPYNDTLSRWTVTVESNDYTIVRTAVLKITVTSSSLPTECSKIVLNASTDDAVYTELTPTFADGSCIYQGSMDIYGQTVNPGDTSNVWFFESSIDDPAGIAAGITYQWTVQPMGV